MKKALLILSLIYFIYCKTLCSDEADVKEASECFAREADYENTSCCFVDATMTMMGETQTGVGCYSFKPGISNDEVGNKMAEEIKKILPEGSEVTVKVNSYKCPSSNSGSFLKIGFLFLVLFLF